ncbi:DinI-like family protein [Haemophilus paracuniculus]|nr:DinI-like family protein [Haemophilus paracuniculus]
MQQSIDLALLKPQSIKEPQFLKAIAIVEEKLKQEYPNAIVRVRQSPSMSGLSVFGFGKNGRKEIEFFLENLFNDSYLFDEY